MSTKTLANCWRSVPRSVSKAHLELETVDYLLEQQ